MPRWCEYEENEHKQRGRHLGYRAILEVLENALDSSNVCKKEDNIGLKVSKLKRRGLTKMQMKTYNDFKTNVLKRFHFELIGDSRQQVEAAVIEKKLDALNQQWEHCYILFEYIVGLQLFLQYLLEGLVTLDRLLYLEENGLYPKAFTIFDEKISPRCTVIHCNK